MKNALLLILLALANSLFSQRSTSDFVFTINGNSYTLFVDPSSMSIDIDWEDDGVFDTTFVNQTLTHQYAQSGNHTIRIRGFYSRMVPASINLQNAAKVVSVDQWGDAAWTNMASMFSGCQNITAWPLDTPNTSQVTDFGSMFYNCSNFNEPLNHWDISSATDLSYMFYGCSNFNQPLSSWDVSNVTDMSSLFQAASSFNQTLNSWDVSSVTSLSYTFAAATSFNQPLNNWDVSAVTDMTGTFRGAINFNQALNNWDVFGVTSMGNMFNNALSFNQPIDSWNTSTVTFMTWMFRDARSFNQALHHLDFSNFNQGSFYHFLDNTSMSVANYDSLIIHLWNTIPNRMDILGAAGLEYCASDSIRNLLIGSGWSFVGDSLNCLPVGIEDESSKVDFLLYPNPASEQLNISFSNFQNQVVRIFNQEGRLVRELEINASEMELDVSTWSNGIYFLQAGKKSRKFMVRH